MSKVIKVAVIVSPTEVAFYEGGSLVLKDGTSTMGQWTADQIAQVEIIDPSQPPPGGGDS
jgi:hypothetical protein